MNLSLTQNHSSFSRNSGMPATGLPVARDTQDTGESSCNQEAPPREDNRLRVKRAQPELLARMAICNMNFPRESLGRNALSVARELNEAAKSYPDALQKLLPCLADLTEGQVKGLAADFLNTLSDANWEIIMRSGRWKWIQPEEAIKLSIERQNDILAIFPPEHISSLSAYHLNQLTDPQWRRFMDSGREPHPVSLLKPEVIRQLLQSIVNQSRVASSRSVDSTNRVLNILPYLTTDQSRELFSEEFLNGPLGSFILNRVPSISEIAPAIMATIPTAVLRDMVRSRVADLIGDQLNAIILAPRRSRIDGYGSLNPDRLSDDQLVEYQVDHLPIRWLQRLSDDQFNQLSMGAISAILRYWLSNFNAQNSSPVKTDEYSYIRPFLIRILNVLGPRISQLPENIIDLLVRVEGDTLSRQATILGSLRADVSVHLTQEQRNRLTKAQIAILKETGSFLKQKKALTSKDLSQIKKVLSLPSEVIALFTKDDWNYVDKETLLGKKEFWQRIGKDLLDSVMKYVMGQLNLTVQDIERAPLDTLLELPIYYIPNPQAFRMALTRLLGGGYTEQQLSERSSSWGSIYALTNEHIAQLNHQHAAIVFGAQSSNGLNMLFMEEVGNLSNNFLSDDALIGLAEEYRRSLNNSDASLKDWQDRLAMIFSTLRRSRIERLSVDTIVALAGILTFEQFSWVPIETLQTAAQRDPNFWREALRLEVNAEGRWILPRDESTRRRVLDILGNLTPEIVQRAIPLETYRHLRGVILNFPGWATEYFPPEVWSADLINGIALSLSPDQYSRVSPQFLRAAAQRDPDFWRKLLRLLVDPQGGLWGTGVSTGGLSAERLEEFRNILENLPPEMIPELPYARFNGSVLANFPERVMGYAPPEAFHNRSIAFINRLSIPLILRMNGLQVAALSKDCFQALIEKVAAGGGFADLDPTIISCLTPDRLLWLLDYVPRFSLAQFLAISFGALRGIGREAAKRLLDALLPEVRNHIPKEWLAVLMENLWTASPVARDRADKTLLEWLQQHYAQMGADEFEAHLPRLAELAALSQSEREIVCAQIRALKAEEFGKLSAAGLMRCIRMAQSAPFSQEQWAQVTPATLRALMVYDNNNVDELISRFSDDQLRWWTPAQVAAVFAGCRLEALERLFSLQRLNGFIWQNAGASPEQREFYKQVLRNITAEDIRLITRARRSEGEIYPHLSSFGDDFFLGLRPEVLAEVSPDVMRFRRTDFVRDLNAEQRRALTAGQVAELVVRWTSDERFTPEVIADLNFSQVRGVDLVRLGIPETQAISLFSLQNMRISNFQGMSRDQALMFYNRLTPEQIEALPDELRAFFKDLAEEKSVEEASKRRPNGDGGAGGGSGRGGSSGSGGPPGGGAGSGGARPKVMDRLRNTFPSLVRSSTTQRTNNRHHAIRLLPIVDIQEGGAEIWKNNGIAPFQRPITPNYRNNNGFVLDATEEDSEEYQTVMKSLSQDQRDAVQAKALSDPEVAIVRYITPDWYFSMKEDQLRATNSNPRFGIPLEPIWSDILPEEDIKKSLNVTHLPAKVTLEQIQNLIKKASWKRIRYILTPEKIKELGNSWIVAFFAKECIKDPAQCTLITSAQLAAISDDIKKCWTVDDWNRFTTAQLNGELAKYVNLIPVQEMENLKDSFYKFPEKNVTPAEKPEIDAKYTARIQRLDTAHVRRIPTEARDKEFFEKYLGRDQFSALTAGQLNKININVTGQLSLPFLLSFAPEDLRTIFSKLDDDHIQAVLKTLFREISTLQKGSLERQKAVELLKAFMPWQIELITKEQWDAVSLNELDYSVLNYMPRQHVQSRTASQISEISPEKISLLDLFFSRFKGQQIVGLTKPQIAEISEDIRSVIIAWGSEIVHLRLDIFRNSTVEDSQVVEKILLRASKDQWMVLGKHLQNVDWAKIKLYVWKQIWEKGGADAVKLLSPQVSEALSKEYLDAIPDNVYVRLVQRIYAWRSNADMEIQRFYDKNIPTDVWRQTVIQSIEGYKFSNYDFGIYVPNEDFRRLILNGKFKLELINLEGFPPTPIATSTTSTPRIVMPFPIELKLDPSIATQIQAPPRVVPHRDPGDL